jgi:surfactin synthase thioesterase subunit
VKPQIFGLHFSGGNGYSLQGLFAKLKNNFEVHLTELPGRGKRLDEPLLCKRDEAVADLLQQIQQKRKDVPYIIYGHSMGAELGFIVVKEMELANDAPVYFIPTGNAGPNIHKRENIAALPRAAFFDMLKKMGGIANEVLEDEELMDFFEPIVRADFELLENAEQIHIDFKINTPVHAMMGSEETYSGKIENWRSYTHGSFDYSIMQGNHFFINQHAEEINKIIRDSFHKGLEPVYKIDASI